MAAPGARTCGGLNEAARHTGLGATLRWLPEAQVAEAVSSSQVLSVVPMTPSEFFKWLAIEFDSWNGWDWFRTHEGEDHIQKIEWFEVSELMEVDHSDVVDEILEVETICLCCGQRPEACDNNGLSLP